MASEVGVAFVRLVPSMRGFSAVASRELAAGLGGPAKKAGDDAGGRFTDGLGSGLAAGQSRFAGMGAKISGVFKTALLAGGAVAAAALMVGFTSALETEAATDKLAAQLGGSQWAQDMGEVAGDLYVSGFGQSVTDTADAVKQVLQAGLLPEDATNAQVESMTAKVLTFADVLDQDVGMSINAVGQMLRTGLARDGVEALDVLTRGVQQGADKAGDLAETFNEYSTLFRDLGLSGAEAMGLISQGVQAGARDADIAADALKEFAIRAQDGSTLSAQGFQLIGLNAEEMTAKVAAGGPVAREALGQVLAGLQAIEDPVTRNAAAVALFGTQAEDMGDALFALDLDTAVQGLGDVAGATGDLGSAYDNAATKIETFKRQALEKLTTFVGNTVIPALEGLTKWAKENPTALKIVGGIAVGVFGAWAIAATAAAIASSALTLPLLLIGIAVGGLAALFIIHWDTIKGAVAGAFNWVRDNWPLLLAILTGPIGLAVLAIVRNWDTIKDGFTAVKDWISARVDDVVGFVTGIPGRIAGVASTMFDAVKDAATTAKDWVSDRVGDVVTFFTDLPTKIGDVISGLADTIKSPFTSAFDAIKDLWNDTVGGFGFTVPSWVPGVGGKSFSIPSMHTGGIFDPGGDEGVALLQRGEGVFTEEQMAALAPARSAPAGATLVLNAAGADRYFVAFLRHFVATQGRGDVQNAFGQ